MPIGLRIYIPQHTVLIAQTPTPSPIASSIAFPAITLSTELLIASAVTLAISSPGFVRDLGGSDVAGTITQPYVPAKQKLFNGSIDLDTDDIRVLLLMTNTTADTETDIEFISEFTTLDEFNGAGYARQALATEAVNLDTPNARAEFDADDVAFGALTTGTRQIDAGIIFKFVTNDADSIPIFLLQFTNFNPGGGALTLEWNAEGIAWLT